MRGSVNSPWSVLAGALLFVSALAPVDGSAQEQPSSSAPPSVQLRPASGFVIESADRTFAIAPAAWLQPLYTLAAEGGQVEHGLTVRRARVVLSGHAFGEHNRLFLQLGLSPSDMLVGPTGVRRTPLLDAYLEFTQLRDLSLRLGQYRVPFSRQRVMPFGNLALIDRAAVNFEFNLDRDLGLHVFSPDLLGRGLFRYQLGIFMGEGRDAQVQQDSGMLYTARIEALPLGMFDDYSEVDLERSPALRASLGLGYAFLDNGKGDRGILGPPPPDGGTTDSHHFTADALLKLHGVTLLLEAHYRNGRRSFGSATVTDENGMIVPAPQEAPRDGYGWFVQVDSLLGPLPLDATGRYGQIRGARHASSLTDADELGGGIAWNLGARRFRVQADFLHSFVPGHFKAGHDELRVSARLGI
jgi:phosphate-selective porin OprO/OprP